MKDLVIILITFFCITSAEEWECPAVETLKQCLCYPKSKTIHCVNVTELPELKEKFNYDLIIFKNISLNKISKTDLGSATFKKIVIEDNKNLATLDDGIFVESPEVLVIRNNPNLKMDPLFKALKNMKMAKIVEIEKNNLITEVENRAFNNSLKLKQIFLQNNSITTIKEEAFIGLNDLKEIRLDNNKIRQLNKKCFDVNSTIIEINLNNNMLTAGNLEGITSKNTTIILHLENTNLTVFPKTIFLPLLPNNKSMVYLSGNHFQCSCDNMIWLLDRNYTSLSRQIIHLNCNDYNKDIFKLTRKDICGEETSPPTTIEPPTPTEQPTRTEETQKTPEPTAPTKQVRTEKTQNSPEPTAPTEQVRTEKTQNSPEPIAPTEQSSRQE